MVSLFRLRLATSIRWMLTYSLAPREPTAPRIEELRRMPQLLLQG